MLNCNQNIKSKYLRKMSSNNKVWGAQQLGYSQIYKRPKICETKNILNPSTTRIYLRYDKLG